MDIRVGLSNIAVMLCTAVTESQTSYQDLSKKVILQLAELCLPDKLAELKSVLQSGTKPVCALDNVPVQTFSSKINERMKKLIEEVETVEEQLQSEVLINEQRLDDFQNQPQILSKFNNESNIHLQMMKQRRETNELIIKRLQQNQVQYKEKLNRVKSLKSEAPSEIYKLLYERLWNIVFKNNQEQENGPEQPQQVLEVQMPSLLQSNMRMSGFYKIGTKDLVWPANPSYNNPINYIYSTSPDSIYPYFNFTLQTGERSNLIEVNEKCENHSKKIERVRKAIIYYTQIDSTLMGIKLIGETNDKICTMGLCDDSRASIATKEISLKDKERIVGFASHTHGNALHFGFRFTIASSDC